MRVAFYDNGGKGQRIATALIAAGHELHDTDGDVAVIDHEHQHQALCDRHETVVLYPHGGNPQLDWDGHLDPHPHTRLHLVHGPGHAEVMAAYGYPVRCVPVGWCYGPLAPMREPCEPRRVLFGPAHEIGTGYLSEPLRALNLETEIELRAEGFEVSVRTNGGLGFDDIDRADVVVADGTLAHLALARGVPTVMLGGGLCPDLGHTAPVFPASWASYAPLMAYPFTTESGPLGEAVRAAAADPGAVGEYRRRFVGGPFDADLVVRLIEEVVQ